MEPFTKVWPWNITTCPDYPRCNFNHELVYCQGLIVVILSSHKHDSLIFRKSSMSKYCTLKVGFHRVECCAIEENALKLFFRILIKQKLPLYERFSELRCKVEFNSTLRGCFLRSTNQMAWWMWDYVMPKIIMEIDLRFLRYSGKIARAYSAIAQNSTLWKSTFR